MPENPTMRPYPYRSLMLFLLACALAATAWAGSAANLPKVRAITAFVRLDRAAGQAPITAALAVLRSAQSEFEKRGYEVQSVRIVTQPLAELIQGQSETAALAYLQSLDALAAKEGFRLNVGPAMLQDSDDPRTMRLLEKALTTLSNTNASAIIAGEDGIHWKVIKETATLVRYLTEHTPNSQGTFSFTATAMTQPYGPFYPGAYHTGPGKVFSIGFESANIVQRVFAQTHGDYSRSVAELTQQLTVHARVAESIGQQLATTTGWTFAGVDPTPAPLGEHSIGAAIESYSGGKFGSSGTLTAALIITAAVKAVPVKQIGYSGLMVPVMEDKLLAQRWAEGSFNTDDLLAYSAVCGTGLDTVPFPGDISADQLARIFGDVASLAWKWHKPLSARLQPVNGKHPGDQTSFGGPFLFNTTLHAVP